MHTRVISVLRTKDLSMEEWRRLPKHGRLTGKTGWPTSGIWEWTFSSRAPRTPHKSGASVDLLHGSDAEVMDGDAQLKATQF